MSKPKHRRNVSLLIRNLRSKKWEQSTGALAKEITRFVDGKKTTKIGYCCLGVASELAPGVIKILQEDNHRFIFSTEDVPWSTSSVSLIEPVQDWLGVKRNDPWVLVAKDKVKYFKATGDRWYTLINLNDKGYTFEEIADILDDQPYEWDGTKPTIILKGF